MVGHGAKFGRKKEEAIAALLTQRNIEEAARTAGVGTQTLLRWLKVPEFETAYREAAACTDAPPEAWRGIGLVAMKEGDRAAAKDAFTAYRSHAPDAGDKAMIDFYLTQL